MIRQEGEEDRVTFSFSGDIAWQATGLLNLLLSIHGLLSSLESSSVGVGLM